MSYNITIKSKYKLPKIIQSIYKKELLRDCERLAEDLHFSFGGVVDTDGNYTIYANSLEDTIPYVFLRAKLMFCLPAFYLLEKISNHNNK